MTIQKKYKLLITLSFTALIAAGCNSTTTSTTTHSPSSAPQQTLNPSPTPTDPPVHISNSTTQPAQHSVSYTNNGFSPKKIIIKKGETIIFQNNSSTGFWPASNPHPLHTDYPGFDAQTTISPGQSYQFIFNKIGTWGYHDHLNESLGGAIIVQ